jgi:hypothetical protein
MVPSSTKYDTLLIGWNDISRRNAVIPHKNRVHAAVGRVADVTVRVIAELVVAFARFEHLPNVRLQPPCTQNGTVGS